MKTEEIKQLFADFESAASEIEGVECWRKDMQILLGYTKWENFEKVIQKAKDACENAGEKNHWITFLRRQEGDRSWEKGAIHEIDDIVLRVTPVT